MRSQPVPGIADLLKVVDSYKAAAGVDADSTVSSRVFRDGKKIGALRDGRADITLGRFAEALNWFERHWPKGAPMPELVRAAAPVREAE